MIMKNILFLFCFLISLQITAQSTVKFRIKNAGFTVNGSFSSFTNQISFDPQNLSQSKLSGVVKVESVNTANSMRDNHLRNADYFDVKKFPTMKFESASIQLISTNKFKVNGNLTIKDVTKKVSFEMNYQLKNGKQNFDASWKINRLDYHVGESSWVTDDELSIDIHIEK